MKLEEMMGLLGEPTRSGDNWAVYRGDCMELLAGAAQGSDAAHGDVAALQHRQVL